MSSKHQSLKNIIKLQNNLNKLEKELTKLKETLSRLNQGKMKMEPVYIYIKSR